VVAGLAFVALLGTLFGIAAIMATDVPVDGEE